MKKLAVITTTRAEYGLLQPVLQYLRSYENADLRIDLVVSGTHLDDRYGLTVQEIENAKIRIDHRIYVRMKSEGARDISETYSEIIRKFAVFFSENSYNAILILGDRYETMAIAVTAGIMHIPVFHMYGGDTTEGALDEWMRHSITKIAYLHFVSNEVSRKRVIQLGEDPQRVYDFGSTSIDNILSLPNISKGEALKSIGLQMCNYVLGTFQPVTMETNEVEKQITPFLEAIIQFPEIVFIVTKANADQGGMIINRILEKAQKNIPNMRLFSSLGVNRYIGLMRHCEFVFGNSSSGIIEAPTCKVPTVNIGDRQRGRLRADSVIDCENTTGDICKAIEKARMADFREKCKMVSCPYGTGNAAERIAAKCIEVLSSEDIELKKKFYDYGDIG